MLSSVRVGWVYFILSIGTFLAVLAVGFSVVYWLPFLGGIFAAIAIRFDKLRSALCTPIASVVAIMAVVALLWFYPTGFGLAQTMLIAAAFLIVASGNEMFGLLSGRLSRILGEMSYGIYLLHGLLLFITFRFVIGFDVAKSFDPITHWLVIIGLTPILIVISAISYLKVERPAMSQTRVVANWLNSRLGKQSN